MSNYEEKMNTAVTLPLTTQCANKKTNFICIHSLAKLQQIMIQCAV